MVEHFRRVCVTWTETHEHSAYVEIELAHENETPAEIRKRLNDSGDDAWIKKAERHTAELEHREVLDVSL